MKNKYLYKVMFMTFITILSFCLFFNYVVFKVSAQYATVDLSAVGTLTNHKTTITDNIKLDEYDLKDSAKTKKIYNVTLTNAASDDYEMVIHHVANGEKIALNSVLNIAKNYEETTGLKVMYGVNADFFSTNTNMTINTYYANNTYYNYDSHYKSRSNAGFDNNGNFVLDKVDQANNVKIILHESVNGEFAIYPNKYNQLPNDGEISYYTQSDSQELDSSYIVYKIKTATNQGFFFKEKHSKITLASKQVALVVKGDSYYARYINNIIDDEDSISFKNAPGGIYQGMKNIIGGHMALVKDSKVATYQEILDNYNQKTEEAASPRGISEHRPRTSVGINGNGELMLNIIEGDGGNSLYGMTIQEQAYVMGAMGATQGLELDGGGSTTLVARVDDNLKIINKANLVGGGGSPRPVANALLIVEKKEPIDVGLPTEPEKTKYTVRFNSNGGSDVASVEVEENSLLVKPNDPIKTDYNFVGWYTDTALTQEYNFSSSVTSNITLYAKWKEKEIEPEKTKYTVTFNSNDGSNVASVEVEENSVLVKPNDPIKTDYNFVGWYTDTALTQTYNFSSPVTSNITLYAKWQEKETDVTGDGDNQSKEKGTGCGSQVQGKNVMAFIIVSGVVVLMLPLLILFRKNKKG